MVKNASLGFCQDIVGITICIDSISKLTHSFNIVSDSNVASFFCFFGCGKVKHTPIFNNGCEVIGMVASYTYGFDVAEKAFEAADVKLITLTNYEAVLEVAQETGYITEDELPLLNEWRKDPAHWNQ